MSGTLKSISGCPRLQQVWCTKKSTSVTLIDFFPEQLFQKAKCAHLPPVVGLLVVVVSTSHELFFVHFSFTGSHFSLPLHDTVLDPFPFLQ